MKKLIVYLMLFLYSCACYSQEAIKNEADTLRKDALNLFYTGASSYLKQRIPYVNYVRDRKVADLVIISATEGTGGGGRVYTYFLEGQLLCDGMIDTLSFNSSADETYEQIRAKRVKTLKLGLIRYVQKTPLSEYLDVRFTEPMATEVTTDKWNSWVFRAGVNGHTNGQSSYTSTNVSGNISASKVTEDWKFSFSSRYSSGKQSFDMGEGDIYKSENYSKSANMLLVRSINDHWSVGGRSSISSSSYSNYDLRFSIMPAIEYDVFPYTESTRRQFLFRYTIGYMYNNYTDTTIYNRTQEGLFSHSLMASYDIVQKWGNINISSSWSNYLRDFSQNSLSLHGSISWRVAKGLRINMGGSFSFIHDQISLVKGGASTEEILLRRKEIETSFSYYTSFGLSYTFGSIYNNTVNPRFGGGGGGMMYYY